MTKDLDLEDDIFFYDDFFYIPKITKHELDDIISLLSYEDDVEKIDQIQNLIQTFSDDFPLKSLVIALLDKAKETESLKKEAKIWYIKKLQENSYGMQRSHLIEEATKIFEKEPESRLLSWLDILADEKRVEIMKKNGRYWVQVL